MARNRMREKEYQFTVIADTIDYLLTTMDCVTTAIDNYENQYHENGDEWYKAQADDQRVKLSAYSAIIDYLEKFH